MNDPTMSDLDLMNWALDKKAAELRYLIRKNREKILATLLVTYNEVHQGVSMLLDQGMTPETIRSGILDRIGEAPPDGLSNALATAAIEDAIAGRPLRTEADPAWLPEAIQVHDIDEEPPTAR